MNRYSSYQSYKESGIEWIGQLPNHWRVGKLKHLGTLKGGAGFPINLQGQSDLEVGFYKVGDLAKSLDGKYLSDTSNTLNREDAIALGATIFPERTIVWAKIGGALFLNRRRFVKSPCCIDNNMTGFVVDESKVSSEYAYHLTSAIDFAYYAKPGAVPSLSEGEQSSIPVAIPPCSESHEIAKKLNYEITRIDTLINKKTIFIELLKEKRQCLIIDSATKGRNTNVPLKNSGIEWVGTIPAHWEVKPFFALLSELNRKNIGLIETNILSLSYGRIVRKSDNRNMGLVPESYETYQIVEPGDVVFRFTDLQNDKRSLRSAEVIEKGIITSAYMAIRPHSIQSTYFAWLMRSYDLCKVFYGLGGGIRQSLKFEDVKRLPIVVPPVSEQIEISKFIERQLNLIDTLIEKTQRSIDLLKERRIAFITAAVTGKIDVNNKQESIS
ncbi:restriction endonuclease subunit S [Ferrovum sp. PN-J185]|uniref:restriction endonuclease subunit S n=1 Tax=Ferrovum sp. PN-J185 TaxID=1356306 RepID=UPI001E40E007|nr:restriction endonuclease subunit S [Ferrovum sp. PN-J185]MCC6069217.1 restriction endonuclease subunit S [Ferrovum sp. PN-J185]